MFSYLLDDITYIQKPLVLGQIRQLIKLLEDLIIPRDISVIELVSVLGDKLPTAIAIVIVEEGKNLKDKNIETLAGELEFKIPPEMALEVIENFFDLNPMISLFERLGKLAEKLNKTIQKT